MPFFQARRDTNVTMNEEVGQDMGRFQNCVDLLTVSVQHLFKKITIKL